MQNSGTNDNTSPLKQAAEALNKHDGNVQTTLARIADVALAPLQQAPAEGIRQAELAKTGTQNDVAVSAPMNVRRRTKGGPASG
jgi:hypothetical protein